MSKLQHYAIFSISFSVLGALVGTLFMLPAALYFPSFGIAGIDVRQVLKASLYGFSVIGLPVAFVTSCTYIGCWLLLASRSFGSYNLRRYLAAFLGGFLPIAAIGVMELILVQYSPPLRLVLGAILGVLAMITTWGMSKFEQRWPRFDVKIYVS